jgi:hypothetical protein
MTGTRLQQKTSENGGRSRNRTNDTRIFKSHRQLIRKYFNNLYRRNRGATQVRQASIFIFDGAFQALARRNFEVECRLNDNRGPNHIHS